MGVIVLQLVLVAIFHVFALLFKGKSQYMSFFRASSHSTILNWFVLLTVIPYIGYVFNLIITIWGIVVLIFIIKIVYQLTLTRAILVFLIPIIILMAVLVFVLKTTLQALPTII